MRQTIQGLVLCCWGLGVLGTPRFAAAFSQGPQERVAEILAPNVPALSLSFMDGSSRSLDPGVKAGLGLEVPVVCGDASLGEPRRGDFVTELFFVTAVESSRFSVRQRWSQSEACAQLDRLSRRIRGRLQEWVPYALEGPYLCWLGGLYLGSQLELADLRKECQRTCQTDGETAGQIAADAYCMVVQLSQGSAPELDLLQFPDPTCGERFSQACSLALRRGVKRFPETRGRCEPYLQGAYASMFENFVERACASMNPQDDVVQGPVFPEDWFRWMIREI